MNILFLTHYFPPEVNAPATRTYEHCKRWVAAGNDVTVITCVPNCPDGIVYEGYRNRWRSQAIVDGITIIRVWTYLAPNKGFTKRIVNYVSYLCTATLAALWRKNVDVIVATSPQFFCGWAGVLCHWLRRWPFVLEIRDIWPESILAVGAMQKSPFIRALESLEETMYSAADHIVTVGEGYKRRICEKGVSADKVTVVMNGVDTSVFKRIDDVRSVRQEYRAEGKFVCAYIGTVGMAHGLEVMLDAAEACINNGDVGIVFWVVGDGAHREKLELEAQRRELSNVVFTGRLPKERMPAVISACDACLVHLRGTELFGSVIPSKLFELMAMDTPIIMGVRGQALDLVREAGAGVAMEPDSAESLLAAIAEIKKRGREAFSGRAFVSAKFNRNVLAQRMLEVLATVAKGRP